MYVKNLQPLTLVFGHSHQYKKNARTLKGACAFQPQPLRRRLRKGTTFHHLVSSEAAYRKGTTFHHSLLQEATDNRAPVFLRIGVALMFFCEYPYIMLIYAISFLVIQRPRQVHLDLRQTCWKLANDNCYKCCCCYYWLFLTFRCVAAATFKMGEEATTACN